MKFSKSQLLSLLFLLIILLLTGVKVLAVSGGQSYQLPNPLGSNSMTVVDVFIRVLQVALGIISLFALSMFVYGGLVMLTSGGNPDKVKKAKDTLVWAILGLAIILFSGTIVRYIFDNFQF